MMKERDELIKKLLRREVALKSFAPTITFAAFAVLAFFYGLGCTEYLPWIQLLSVVAFLASLLRLGLSQKIKKHHDFQDAHWNLIKCSVWVNGVSWGVIFSLGALEHSCMGTHYMVMMGIITGFVSASILTLGYDKILFFPFQCFILGPQIVIASYLYWAEVNHDAHQLAVIFTIFFLYQWRQFKDFQGQLLQRFSYELDLEETNHELVLSQKALVNQTSKLMQTSKIAALGEMAGGLAHEVNNPLMIILGSNQQIERALRTTDDQHPMLKNIERSIAAVSKIKLIIEGLNGFGHQMDESPKEVTELSSIIEKTLYFCQEMLVAHEIRLEQAVIPELKIFCHPFQVTQVLFNLIKNSDDALTKSVPPEDRWLKLSFTTDRTYVYIHVINGGPSIDALIASRLFHPFFTTKELGQSIGLNLSISKGIAVEHKGDLSYESHSKNTHFTLKLPLDSSADE